MTPITPSWEERFEEMEKNHGWIPEHKERIISFISQEKALSEREGYERAKHEKDTPRQ